MNEDYAKYFVDMGVLALFHIHFLALIRKKLTQLSNHVD